MSETRLVGGSLLLSAAGLAVIGLAPAVHRSASAAPAVEVSDLDVARLFAVTVETGMPHLEENLRYTTTHENRCLARADLSTVFPVLAHPILAGCRLSDDGPNDGGMAYHLVCQNGHGTTGHARWTMSAGTLRGRFDVKLGGKNMTFSQTVTAVTIGSCPSNR
jgi:hypothetical protein